MDLGELGSFLNAAPSNEAASAVLTGLAPDGTLVLCGYDSTPLTLQAQPMVLNHPQVMASPSGSPHDLRDTLVFSAQHRILPAITPITLDQAPGDAGGHGRRIRRRSPRHHLRVALLRLPVSHRVPSSMRRRGGGGERGRARFLTRIGLADLLAPHRPAQHTIRALPIGSGRGGGLR